MKQRDVTIWVMLGVLLLGCPRLLDAVQFKDGLTHDIDYTIYTSVWVDNMAPGMQTTVNLLPSGYIHFDLRGYNESRLNITGGKIGEWLFAFDSSRVTISGGEIGKDLAACFSSQVTMTGGSIGDDLEAYNSSQVTMTGGSIGDDLEAYDSSQVTMSGGTIGGGLFADYYGILTIQGSDFAVDGVPFGYGELTSILGGHWLFEPSRHLSGVLASGDLLDNDFYIGHSAKIVLVPEPATILLLGLGGLAVLRRRKS